MKFIILGCGSSMGVPRPDGFFGNCDPNNKKNYRTRCSALLKTTDENILIDTSPDLRQQLLRHKIKKINKVLFSHMHGDQTHGINDLRSFYINSRKQINVYADIDTSKYLKNSFSYIFKSYSKEYPATLNLNKLPKNIFTIHKNKKIKISFNNKSKFEQYKNIHDSKLIIGMSSTMLREAFEFKKKILICNFFDNPDNKPPSDGICTLKDKSYNAFKNRVSEILSMTYEVYLSKIQNANNFYNLKLNTLKILEDEIK